MARRKMSAGEVSQETGVATADTLPPREEITQKAPIERESGDEPQAVKLPNPFAWKTDESAGVQFRTARDPYQAEIAFKDGKPSEEVRKTMKDAGFRWNPPYEAWTRPIGYTSQAQDRLIAERTSNAVMKQVREEKGIETSQEMSHTPF